MSTTFPQSIGAFVGRTEELATLQRLAEDGKRLITLVGPPGAGKTRLARRYGEIASIQNSSPVRFVDLSEAQTLADVLEAVDEFTSNASETLVLDNFEQVVASAPKTVGSWLEQFSGLRFVVTSRERLRLPGEVVLELAPLPLPTADEEDKDQLLRNDAITLFIDCVRDGRPDYKPSESDLLLIRDVVRRLDGLPLAMVLAAARLSVMGIRQLRDRLGQQFDVLTHQSRGAVDRQATLRAAIDWSWDLLEPPERSTLAQCAVFRGGFTLEAAEAVVDLSDQQVSVQVLDAIQALRDKSLLISELGPDSEMRIGLYGSVRDYSAEQLDEFGLRQDTERRHAAHFAELVHSDHGPANRLLPERDNLIAILDRFAAPDPENPRLTRMASSGSGEIGRPVEDPLVARWVLSAAIGLDPLLANRGQPRNQLVQLERALQVVSVDRGADPTLTARVVIASTRVLQRMGLREPARKALNQARQLSQGNEDSEVAALLAIEDARLSLSTGHLDEASTQIELATKLATANKTQLSAGLLTSQINIAAGREPSDIDKSLAIARGLEDVSAQTRLFQFKARADMAAGRLQSAARALQEAHATSGESRDEQNHALSAFLATESGDMPAARLHLDQAGDTLEAKLARARLHMASQEFGLAVATLEAVGRSPVTALGRSAQVGALIAQTCINLELKDHGAALQASESALAVVEQMSDDRIAFRAVAIQSLALAEASHSDDAKAYLEASEALLEHQDDDRIGRLTLKMFALLDPNSQLTEADESALIREVSTQHGGKLNPNDSGPPVNQSWLLRWATDRVLARLPELSRAKVMAEVEDPSGSSLLVCDDGRWFRAPGAEWSDLGNRRQFANLLLLLISYHESRPDEPITMDELVDGMWPDERMHPDAATNRIGVAIAALRKARLQKVLLSRRGEGYWLDGRVTVIRG